MRRALLACFAFASCARTVSFQTDGPSARVPDMPRERGPRDTADAIRPRDLKQELAKVDLPPGCGPVPCDPSWGNVVILSSYKVGALTIDVDVDISNLKVGIVYYDAGLTVAFTGPHVGKITAVHLAGYEPAGAVAGVAPSIVTRRCSGCVGGVGQSPCLDPNGEPSITCGEKCEDGTSNGGCNTQGQIERYFLSVLGGTLRWHNIKYGAYGTVKLSKARPSCCGDVY